MVNFASLDIGDCSLSILTAGQLLQFSPEDDDFEGYIVLISPEFFQRMNINLLMSLPPRFVVSLVKAPVRPVVPIQEMYFDTVLDYISLLFRVCSHTENAGRDICAADLLRSFLGEAGFYISRHIRYDSENVRPSVMSRFLALVQANYKSHRDVGFYAKKVSLSTSQLYRKVKEESGKSAKDWIDEYALSEAKSLLSSTSLSVEEIADMLGFQSQSFFGKYFKRLSGMSPTGYRSRFFRG
jgi:AraC-type DNA-binding domain-containing proteins